MKLVECTACGSKELVDENGVTVCTYCQSRYVPDVGESTVAGPISSQDTKAAFDVILSTVGRNKIGVIKSVMGLNGSGLKDAKKLVESAPQAVLKNVSFEAAQSAKASLEAAGCTVSIE